MRAAIFIDGGYFLNRLRDERIPADWLDYTRLGEYLLSPIRRELPVDLLRCYFYDCAPWMPENPSDEDNRRMQSHRKFIDEIEQTNRWQVRLGKLERRRDGDQEYFEQKRVDVMLSVDLVRHAAAGHIQHAVLLAGDSDFIPAVAAAKESGVTVSVWGGEPKTVHRELGWMADELRRFDWRAFSNRAADEPKASPDRHKRRRAPGPSDRKREAPDLRRRPLKRP